MKLASIFLTIAVLGLLGAALTDAIWTRMLLLQTGLVYLATALAYLARWSGLFRKRKDGGLPLHSYLLFWPYMLPQRLMYSVHEIVAKETAFDEVCAGLFLGRRLKAAEQDFFLEKGIDTVLDLTAAFAAFGYVRKARCYLSLPILDGAAPRPQQLCEAVAFLEENEQEGSALLVYCAAGHGRSALVLAAFLLETGRANCPSHALDMIKRSRPSIRLKPSQLRALENFAAARGAKTG